MISAFEKFMGIDNELSEIEALVHRLVRSIDEYEDMQLDRFRGN